ncbi:MAG TPA: hypothetical protein H9870_14360 [Candidatus Corynebacterium avicola]|uniref:DUF3093 domain-containing protein n=1 Tax=Candidatus Corynebacterium avicola TaxID=2838527 RepID=A0A9D1UMI8_9CORY|nr:hypothetical protein [Candidatus Corynebacterium avicola]
MTWPVMVLVLGTLGATAVLVLVVDEVPWLFSVPFAVFVIFLMVIVPTWRMQVDDDGFHVRTATGFPRRTIPLEDMAEVMKITVNIWDWGGWGWRKSARGTGLITRSGPGFRIILQNKKFVEVSCTDSDQAEAAVRAISARLGTTSV